MHETTVTLRTMHTIDLPCPPCRTINIHNTNWNQVRLCVGHQSFPTRITYVSLTLPRWINWKSEWPRGAHARVLFAILPKLVLPEQFSRQGLSLKATRMLPTWRDSVWGRGMPWNRYEWLGAASPARYWSPDAGAYAFLEHLDVVEGQGPLYIGVNRRNRVGVP